MASTSTSSDDPLAKAQARIVELQAELEACQRIAQISSQELQHFVYAASHDLQEPLRGIATYTQLLERLYPNDQQAKEFTAFITDGVRRMNGLLSSLLLYSRVNQNPALQSVKLDSAVQGTLFKLATAIKEADAVIRFEALPEILAHEMQMAQLFEQILSNSILYRSGHKPEIEISVEEMELNGEEMQVVKVRDNGVGIEPQFHAQVLQPFKRLHGKNFPGHGLGLAICDKIMRAHKGKIWIESDGQSWTTVHLAFPL